MSSRPDGLRPTSMPGNAAATPDLRGLRAVRDADSQALITLIGGVFDEYPGCVLDLDDLDADLLAPTAQVARTGGVWWVLPAAADHGGADHGGADHGGADHGGAAPLMATVGCSAVVAGATAELKRLYVGADSRRRGLGRALVEHVEAHARTGGASAIELWSDTRFLDAHRLYERLGYTATGETRELHDPSNTTEYRFVRHLDV